MPYLLLAHIDVVPASESDGWEAPPFSAQEIDDFIYGRGTIDDKSPVMVRNQMITCVIMAILNNWVIYLFPFLLPARQNLHVVFHPGNTSGTGVLADKRICSTQRILHRPWSRWRGTLPFYKTCTFLIFLTENNSWAKYFFECLHLLLFVLKVSGFKGAMSIVRVLKQRGVKLSFVMDEGLAILDGVISGLEGPAALWEPAMVWCHDL